MCIRDSIRLAGQLTGYEIDVYRDIDVGEEEDVPLSEFLDEIDGWIIDVFKSIGCDTAKSVLELGVEELSRRTDLEEETIQEVQNILRSEFLTIFLDDIKNIMRYEESSQYISDDLKKTENPRLISP